MNYYQKYLKYKGKYLELKKQIGGVPCDPATDPRLTGLICTLVGDVSNSLEEFITSNYHPASPRRPIFAAIAAFYFNDIFIPRYNLQILNMIGNGLCAFNAIYTFLKLTDDDIMINTISRGQGTEVEPFIESFRENVIASVPAARRADVRREVYDRNEPFLEDVLTWFSSFGGINIMVIDVLYDGRSVRARPMRIFENAIAKDAMILFRHSNHIYLVFSHTNPGERMSLYESLKRNKMDGPP